ncbi:MAG: hypothetical protein WD688_26820 [Candidatus Binatia bacterium]
MPAYKLISVFVFAVLLNYAWELAQAPLYVGLEAYDAGVFWHCVVASLGDGIMVLLIVAAGWVTLRQPDWFVRPGLPGYLIMITAGLVLAVVVEWVSVHRLGQWAYTEKMPIVPGLGIGFVPIAQMLILPPVIFRITAAIGSWKRVMNAGSIDFRSRRSKD